MSRRARAATREHVESEFNRHDRIKKTSKTRISFRECETTRSEIILSNSVVTFLETRHSPENWRNFQKFASVKAKHENCHCNEMTLVILNIPSSLRSTRDDIIHRTVIKGWKLKIEETVL